MALNNVAYFGLTKNVRAPTCKVHPLLQIKTNRTEEHACRELQVLTQTKLRDRESGPPPPPQLLVHVGVSPSHDFLN